MSKFFDDEDRAQQSEAGQAAGGKKPCPICDELVPKPTIPKHIRENHSSDS